MYGIGQAVEIYCTMNRVSPDGGAAIELAWLPATIVAEADTVMGHTMWTIEFSRGFQKTVSENLLREEA